MVSKTNPQCIHKSSFFFLFTIFEQMLAMLIWFVYPSWGVYILCTHAASSIMRLGKKINRPNNFLYLPPSSHHIPET